MIRLMCVLFVLVVGIALYGCYGGDRSKQIDLSEHKRLADYAIKINKNTGVKYYYPDGVAFDYGHLISSIDIDSKFKIYSADIHSLVNKLKSMKSSIAIGNGYVSFYYHGDALGSDEFYVIVNNNRWLDSFKADNNRIGLHVTSVRKIDEDWYYIVAD